MLRKLLKAALFQSRGGGDVGKAARGPSCEPKNINNTSAARAKNPLKARHMSDMMRGR